MARLKIRREALARAQSLAARGALAQIDMLDWLRLTDGQRSELSTLDERITHKESRMYDYSETFLQIEDIADVVAQKRGNNVADTLALKLASQVAEAFPQEAHKAVGSAALSFKTRYKASAPTGTTTVELPSDQAAALEQARVALGGDDALLALLRQAASGGAASETATKAGRVPTFAEMVRGEVPNLIDDRRPR